MMQWEELRERALLLRGGPHALPLWSDFVWTSWLAVVFMIIRWFCDTFVVPAFAKFLARKGRADKAAHVFDNAYIVVWSLLTEVWAVYITLYDNGGCNPWSTGPCLTGWPNHRVSMNQRWYMITMFQFYLNEMIGSMIGIGAPLKKDMVVHHFATMGLISGAYVVNVTRYGIMWQALFDTSNPLLHMAKGLHALELPQLESIKWFFFMLFALTFFVCRCASAPFVILYPAVTRAPHIMPPSSAYPLIGLMVIVCGIQWVWMRTIVAMASGKDTKKQKATKQQ